MRIGISKEVHPCAVTATVGKFVMGRWLRDVLVVATLLASAHAPMAAEHGSTASVIDVKVRSGLLTVNLRDAPLADVLLAIGEQAGFRVLVRGNAKTTVTRSFSDVPRVHHKRVYVIA